MFVPQLLELNWLKWFTKRHREEKTMKSLVITAMTHRKGGLSLCATFFGTFTLVAEADLKDWGGKQFPVSARYRLLLPPFIFSIAAKLQQWKQPNAQSQHY